MQLRPRTTLLLLMACTLFAGTAVAQRSSREARDAALQRAQVKLALPRQIEQARFDVNPEGRGALTPDAVVSCRFHPEPASGTSPKFDCALPDGEVVRVKYGPRNPEVFAEVAATRLLSALGFPTDLVSVVKSVRCFGCPPDPFPALQGCWRDGEVELACLGPLRFDVARDFPTAIIERRFPGDKIEAKGVEGWAWHELDSIHPDDGAPRASIDALRLLAVFLAHWDNKSENQRLVCLDDPARATGQPCNRVVAMIADLGATFGPPKANLKGWTAAPIWADRARCTVSMRNLPYGGSSFHDTAISEAGRQSLARELGALSDLQIRQLFVAARFTDPDTWARVFKEKRQLIASGPPCPDSA